jgi:predicted GNAT family N-acyltransferase
VAEGPADIAACQRVRHRVYVVEKGLLRHDTTELDREVDEYDDLDTTVHIIARVGGAAVATVRLLRPDPQIVGSIGIGLAARYDLAPLAIPDVSVAEGSRMCIVPEHRGGPVFGALCNAMIHEGLRLGLTHLVIAANAETDSLEDAEIVYRVAARDGLVSDRFRVAPKRGASARGPSIRGIYTAEERARARAGDLRGLRLPQALRTFAKHIAARYMGPPIRERDYTVCSLPAVIDLAEAARVQALRRASM